MNPLSSSSASLNTEMGRNLGNGEKKIECNETVVEGGHVIALWVQGRKHESNKANYLLKMRCLSKQPPSTPPYLGYITLRVCRDVKLMGAWRLCLGSGH